jgi:hypothetical protein
VIELADGAGCFPLDLGALVGGGTVPQLGGPPAGHSLVAATPVDGVRSPVR